MAVLIEIQNDSEHIVQLALTEHDLRSVVSAVSLAARILREAGGVPEVGTVDRTAYDNMQALDTLMGIASEKFLKPITFDRWDEEGADGHSN